MQKGVIYSLVSRSRNTILASETQFIGNFPVVALDILQKVDLNKKFSQFATGNYMFYTFCQQNFIFLAMTSLEYEARIAIKFLKTIQTKFFSIYNAQKRNSAVAFSLKSFNKVLKQTMDLYSDKTKVDKLAQLQDQLTSLQKLSLDNLQKVIQRTQKIEVVYKNSQALTLQSYDMRKQSEEVNKIMWWQNRKIVIGIVVGALLIIIALVVTLVVLLTKK